MRLICLLVVMMAILAGCCYDHATAGTTDQVENVKTASKPNNSSGDKANYYLKSDTKSDEERGGLGKLQTIFQKSPKFNTQMRKTSDLKTLQAAALKDPQIMKMKNSGEKIEITSRDVKRLRSFTAKSPLQGLNLIEKLIGMAMVGVLVGGFTGLLVLFLNMINAKK
ncbi:hypothetical protein F442_09348 [Phytophthora nicotianae P10297]|uniref:RxLR effector protein n=1 Tax=Phytophthora nicotianae P10297 TaxID=1317064 RepID=W2ZAL3_PHYNI|nr:hypothetical protein F442_09348 [Phytophthora nicotianae P10297]